MFTHIFKAYKWLFLSNERAMCANRTPYWFKLIFNTWYAEEQARTMLHSRSYRIDQSIDFSFRSQMEGKQDEPITRSNEIKNEKSTHTQAQAQWIEFISFNLFAISRTSFHCHFNISIFTFHRCTVSDTFIFLTNLFSCYGFSHTLYAFDKVLEFV